MSSFFTLPDSQKKRKRDGASKSKAEKARIDPKAAHPHRTQRDGSISGSESDEEGEKRAQSVKVPESSSDSDIVEETGAERRLRYAERYLENIRNEVEEEHGFDAAEIDRDLIAERLKDDVVNLLWRIPWILTSLMTK